MEGAELEVLRGASDTVRTMRPLVLCQVLYRDPKADVAWFGARIEALFALLHEAGYAALRSVKPGNDRVQSLRRVHHIENQAFTQDTFHECNYMFCPEELLLSRFQGRCTISRYVPRPTLAR